MTLLAIQSITKIRSVRKKLACHVHPNFEAKVFHNHLKVYIISEVHAYYKSRGSLRKENIPYNCCHALIREPIYQPTYIKFSILVIVGAVGAAAPIDFRRTDFAPPDY